eukprot:4441939-Lingulodinium_polyedra.AAC.1
MQEAVAKQYRTSDNPHAFFDEEALFDDLETFLSRKGVRELEAREVVQNLVVKGSLKELGDAEELASEAAGLAYAHSDEEIVPVGKVSKHDK